MKEDKESLSSEILELAAELGAICDSRNLQICTAESCTGGLVAGAITEIAGSSSWFSTGVVTYSNAAKQHLLGVAPSVFDQHGAVSEACVAAMAEGALLRFGTDIALSVSGIAGPGGATPGKPVGTVWMAWATSHTGTTSSEQADRRLGDNITTETKQFHFEGGRAHVRVQAVEQILRGTIYQLEQTGFSKI